MSKYKLCPLRKETETENLDYGNILYKEPFGECYNEKCAWWSGTDCVQAENASSLLQIMQAVGLQADSIPRYN